MTLYLLCHDKYIIAIRGVDISKAPAVDYEGKPLDDTYQLKENQFILGTQYYSSVVRAGDVMACYDRESNYLGAIKLTSVKRIGRGDLPYTSPKDANMIGFCAMEEWLLVEAEDDSIVKRLDYMMDTDASAGWKSITSSTPISYVEPIVTDVKKGDKIRFRVNCNNDRWNDNFMLSPEVEYISGYKEITPVYDFAINERYVSKNVGETIQLSTIGAKGNVEWHSSREKVAEVDQNGKVTLKHPGMVSVIANDGKREATCIIAVHENNKNGICFNTKAIKANKGETLELPLEIADGINKSDIKIKSGDNKKVKVNPDGTVTVVSSDIAEVPVVAEYKNHKTEIIICII